LHIPVAFDQKTKVAAFMGWAGFGLFDERVNVVDMSRAYAAAIQEYSCGKCFPCRVEPR